MSYNMNFTIKPTGKHEDLSWVAVGVVTMVLMGEKAYVLHLK